MGLFYVQNLAGIAMNNRKHSSEDLYNRYHEAKANGNKALMYSYVELLRGRAAIGKSDAKKFVDKIERCSKTTLPT